MAFQWTDLIAPGIGAGTQVLGTTLRNKAEQAMSKEQLAQRAHEFDVTQGNRTAELGRRNMLFGMAAPNILRNVGYNPKSELATKFLGKLNTPETSGVAGTPGYAGGYGGPTKPAPSTTSKILGAAGTGLGIAGALGGTSLGASLGLGALGGPVGLAAGGALALGSKLVNKIGQGRRTADLVTGPGGIQSNFNNRLKQIDAMNMPEDQKWQLRTDAFKELVPQALSFAQQGDTQRKVIDQMFQGINFGNPLRGTYAG